MNVLIITAKLASNIVQRESAKSNHNIGIYVVNTPIAAFLTPKRIVKELENPDINGVKSEKSSNKNEDVRYKFDLKLYDIILTPGLIRKDVSYITDKIGVKTYKGPTDAADLAIVLEMIEELDLSSTIPADKLIEEELRKRASLFIENFEQNKKNRLNLLKKPENILVGNLPVGQDFPMRVLAEIANAPLLTDLELLARARYFVESGADMVDIGMIAGETLDERIPKMVKLLKNQLDVAVSIDSLNPVEIKSAVESGVDMVLSLDHGNWEVSYPLSGG